MPIDDTPELKAFAQLIELLFGQRNIRYQIFGPGHHSQRARRVAFHSDISIATKSRET